MPHTLIEIDRASSEPLYRQIRRAIEHGIAVGTFDPHHRLPSSREIAQELGVSRNTVNLAYQELIAEGFVDARERSGLFVNEEMHPHTSLEQVPQCVRHINWSRRMRRYADEHVPHVEKRPDWFTYPFPFLAGQIDLHTFPAHAWARCLRDALFQPHAHHSLQDAVGSDDPMLVEMIRRHLLPSRGIEASPDEVLVTVGSQQGLYLLSQLLLRPGSAVAMEDPGYLDARHIFLRAGARIVPYAVDGSGLRPPHSLTGTDLGYVTPSHQHPTNATLSIGRRRQLLRVAGDSDAVIVEDDYDSEFRYQGSPAPALKALDRADGVVYLGTFSKFLSPGLRLGYLVGPVELVRELRLAARYVNRHPAGHLQRALALLIQSGEYQRSVRRARRALMRKWETACESVNAYLPWETTPPPGGVSLWMTGPAGLDCRKLVAEAEHEGILVERGDIFFLSDDPPRNHFRLGFAATPMRAIQPGIKALGAVVDRLLG